MGGPQRAGYLALVLSALLFGVGTAFAVYALRGLTAFDLLAVEIGSATVTLWLGLAVSGLLRPLSGLGPAARWPVYALLGLLEPALSFVLYNSGLARTSATHGALLESLDGLFVVILGALLLRERLSPSIVLSLLLGLAGAALVATTQGAAGPERVTATGDALVVLGILAAAFYSIAARRLAGGEPALTMTAYQFLAAGILVAPLVLASWLAQGSRLPHASTGQIAAALASGILGTAAAYLLFNVGIARVEAGRAVLVFNLVPVFGTAAAVLGLGEQLHPPEIVGGGLIVLSLFALSFAERTGDGSAWFLPQRRGGR